MDDGRRKAQEFGYEVRVWGRELVVGWPNGIRRGDGGLKMGDGRRRDLVTR